MKWVRFTDSASAELADAVRWYEQQRTGLGAELFDAVAHTVDLIRANPEIGALRAGPVVVRQILVRRFPYIVVYRTREQHIEVVAIAHTSRRPDYWKHRR